MQNSLSEEQVAEIIKGAPKGTTPEGIIAELRNNGYVLKGHADFQESSTTKKSGFLGTNPNDSTYGKLVDNSLTRGVQKVFPGSKVGESIGTLAGYGLSKNKGTYDLNAPSPLQTVGDVALGAASIAGAKLPVAATIPGKAAQFGALGGITGASSELSKGSSSKDVIKGAAKGALVGSAIGAGFGLAEKGIKSLGNFLGKAGDKISVSVIKPSQADIKDGFSVETIKKYNLGGSLKQTFNKTESTLDDLSSQLNKKLADSNSSLDLNKVYENTTKRLLGNKLESFGSNAQMEGAIEKLRNEILSVSGKNGIVSIPEAQLVKRASGHFGAWNFGIPTPEATASQKVYNTFYNELKTAIEKSSPAGVREINQEISKLIPVMNALIRRIPVAERSSSLSLTDIISLSAAALEPRALSVSLLNMASKSGTVGAGLSKFGPKIGKAAEGVIKGVEQVKQATTPLKKGD